jgi:cysteinyl-tRNA synthetase
LTIYLYNTLTRKKEQFIPQDPKRVTMYVCGPTVYNYVHIGNARPVVIFDCLFRLLRTQYSQVVYARNITDIDDRIMETAKAEGVDISVIAERYTKAYAEHMAALHNLTPTVIPKATEHLPQMIRMMETLIASNNAYEADGHVLFAVDSLANYGQLSNRSLDDMLAGARVEVAGYKKHPGDFVLWKPSNDDEPGWDSPWGRGRPGWHTECVVMIESHLGETIDIHGGGKDLIFPHHENELAQARCAHPNHDFVRYWMHNGFINMDGEKMSKSLGNFRTVKDLLGSYRGEVLRYALLSAHYRSEADFSKDLLDQAKTSLDSLYLTLRNHSEVDSVFDANVESLPVFEPLCDDLNTPLALSKLHELSGKLNKADNRAEKPLLKAQLVESAKLLGLLQQDPQQWFTESSSDNEISAQEVGQLIAERNQAKKDKQYARADEIREQLQAQGIILEDSREGTTWRRA